MQADFSSKCPTKAGFICCHDSVTEWGTAARMAPCLVAYLGAEERGEPGFFGARVVLVRVKRGEK